MRYYPLFIDLQNKNVLVVGAGKVGRRKLATLAATPVRRIAVVDPAGLEPEFLNSLYTARGKGPDAGPPASGATISATAAQPFPAVADAVERPCPAPHTSVYRRTFIPQDIQGKHLVFAATGNPDLNREIALLCAEKSILCNCASEPELGDFFVPASCALEGLSVAISTEGKSPALARIVRKDLEAWLGNRYTPLLHLMGRLRPLLLAQGLPPEENALIFRSLAESSLASCLERNKLARSRDLLAELLPASLHASIDELLYEL